MAKKKTTDHMDNKPLRSEKVRALLGEIPPSLVRWGVIIIVVVLMGLMAVVCLLLPQGMPFM